MSTPESPDGAATGERRPAIEATHLVREFGVTRRDGFWRRTRLTVRAVDQLSFTIGQGEAVGLLGAAGAGKSTTIKLIAGLVRPGSGRIRTCGLRPSREQAQLSAQVGVVLAEQSQLWRDLPLAQSLRLLADLHHLDVARCADRRAELIDGLNLSGFLDLPLRQLTRGQRLRGELAAALLHEPGLLLLDEPTTGLDAVSKERLRQFLVSEHATHGRTIVLATPDLGDVERLCGRVLVLDRGALAYDGDVPGLASRAGAQRVLVVDLARPGRPLDDVPGTTLVDVEAGGLRQRLRFTPGAATAAQVLAEIASRARVRDLTIEEPHIEDVVRRLHASA